MVYCDVFTFVTITFWNSYVLILLRFETIKFSDATLKVVTNEKGEAVGEVLTIIC
jgi:hypothetical protein